MTIDRDKTNINLNENILVPVSKISDMGPIESATRWQGTLSRSVRAVQ